jgi:transposase
MTSSTTIAERARAVRTLWCGCDVSKSSFDAAVWLPPESGERREMQDIPAASFPLRAEGAEAFLRWADEHLAPIAGGAEKPSALGVVLEATGRYSIQLATWLIAARANVQPSIINPETARDFIRSLSPRNKTDQIDARGLARYGAERLPSPWEPLTPEQTELRDMARYRKKLQSMCVAEKLRSNEAGITRFVRSKIRDHIAHLERTQAQLEKRMAKIIAGLPELQRDAELLDSVKGVGFITAATVLAEYGDLRRFRRARQLSAFAGFSPRLFESGKSVRKKPRLCKKGSSLGRHALYFPALAAIRGDNDFARMYKDLLHKGKPKMSAIGAVMRKMLLVMRAILISGQPYQPHYRKSRPQPVDNSHLADQEMS